MAEMNGKTGIRITTGVNIVVIIAACFFVWTQLQQVRDELSAMRTEMLVGTSDRLSGDMFIEIQEALKEKNPTINWMKSKEVREIQIRNLERMLRNARAKNP